METTEQNMSSAIMPDSPRPQMLKVISILSFVWIGISGLGLIWSLAFRPSQEEIYEKTEEIRKISEESAMEYQEAMEMQQTTGYAISQAISVAAMALSLLGVIMMWQLKRKGFMLYCLGEILPYTGMFLTKTNSFGSLAKMMHTSPGTVAGVLLGAMIAFDLLFIGLYYSNLKHMKN